MVRPARRLFERLCDPEQLERSALAACRGKRRRPDVAWFLFRREALVREIGAALAAGRWRPRGYELLTIRDPKPRVIARAPIEDRIVHRAIVDVCTPALERSWRPEDMACRVGAGAHRAVLGLQAGMRRHRYALHLDIRAYFPSVDPALLYELLARRIRDERFLHVVWLVLADGPEIYARPEVRRAGGLTDDWPPAGRGLPLGTATSQMFATHVYLCPMDHWIKRGLKVPTYLRYVDDLFLFADRRADLRAWRAEVAAWLDRERGLRLKHPQAPIVSCAATLDALGHRVRRDAVVPRPRRLTHLARRAAAALRGGRGASQAFRRATAGFLGGPWL